MTFIEFIKKVFSNLTFQVILAIIIGINVGIFFPGFAPTAKLISQGFINLISMLIAPIIFFTIVLGIAHMGDMKKVGRVGGKALLYFEIVSTVAIAIGLVVANVLKPGAGMITKASDATKIVGYAEQAKDMNWAEFFLHIIPHNVIAAFAEGNILQILLFAILFGYGLNKLGGEGTSVLNAFDKISKVLFKIMKVIMRLAPIGAFGGMAFSIGTHGLESIVGMAKLMGSVYLTCILFIFIVLNGICRYYNFSLWAYLKYIRQEILIVLGTSSSESALPSMMQKMEAIGCDKSVVGLVIPTGYSFNLDGTAIYLAMAVIFLCQVFHVDLSLGQQITVLGVLMVTSKGAAGVTGSGFIVLVSTLTALKIMPIEHISILIGVDRFMSEARAITNVIGNGVATIVIAKSENQFDEAKYQKAIQPAMIEKAEEV
ncbi:C4-dicarboxylate transport protein [Pedobacter sp. Bi27]|uniref:C4-dicarboxylate transporter DctA n=1 Tax=unclassified Pedobacter TaxID=2628915 RepID=UPI001D4A58B1|nr:MULTISPECIES: C4-dicarboxylate transporter DctA [unclassified Pedobacter]CAH0243530.1 C4-dicarboxylate transport protein [Pedobacter sp. Bi27]CAH0280750.1 C4-dicarboxylate transport protein [Pedobacter sp. Bi126]CAH0307484.1 C4-dicarboxylate transport protein [Pedobacter sp. Bi36]